MKSPRRVVNSKGPGFDGCGRSVGRNTGGPKTRHTCAGTANTTQPSSHVKIPVINQLFLCHQSQSARDYDIDVHTVNAITTVTVYKIK